MKKRKILIPSLIVSLLICVLIMGDSLSSLLRSFRQRFTAQTDTVEVTLVDDLKRSVPLVPGSRIPLDMDVQNLGATCRVRFKVCVYTDGGAQLKANGFHWAPSERAWQTQRTPAALRRARLILGIIND